MDRFDFIVVGGGASGALIASRLAQSPQKSSVLLLEEGNDNRRLPFRFLADRFNLAFTKPELDHGYVTTPQKGLGGRVIRYTRGNGLGGSTQTNFLTWTLGPSADYEVWASTVGDDVWRWENVRRTYHSLENYNAITPLGMEEYIKSEGRGVGGPIDIAPPSDWEPELMPIMGAFAKVNIPINLDINSGDPIGVSVNEMSSNGLERVTSASAFLTDVPSNLKIWCKAKAARILFEGNRAVGIEIVDGRKAFANCEVILSAGAIASPQILLLSGIGPAAELSNLGISVLKDLPGMGKNLQEHCGTWMGARMKAEFSERWSYESSVRLQRLAKEQWDTEKRGPLAHSYGNVVKSFVQLPELYETAEFQALGAATQENMRHPVVPHYEMIMGGSLSAAGYDFGKDSYLTGLSIGMNLQSRGEVTLASADPKEKPVIDLKLLEHPFDRKVMLEAMRHLRGLFEAPSLKKDTIELVKAPKSDSEEDIMDYIEKNATASMHVTGTVAMGKFSNLNACVDTNFRVYGFEGLRVADMSVCPILISNHSQSTAYLIGQVAVEKIIAEYQ